MSVIQNLTRISTAKRIQPNDELLDNIIAHDKETKRASEKAAGECVDDEYVSIFQSFVCVCSF